MEAEEKVEAETSGAEGRAAEGRAEEGGATEAETSAAEGRAAEGRPAEGRAEGGAAEGGVVAVTTGCLPAAFVLPAAMSILNVRAATSLEPLATAAAGSAVGVAAIDGPPPSMVRWAASNWTAEGGGWPPALPLLELFAAAAAGSALGGRMTPPLSVVCTPSKMPTPYSMPRVGRWSVPSCRSGSDGSEAATDLRTSTCNQPSHVRATSHRM